MSYHAAGLTVIRSHGAATGPMLVPADAEAAHFSPLLRTSFWNKRDVSAELTLPGGGGGGGAVDRGHGRARAR